MKFEVIFSKVIPNYFSKIKMAQRHLINGNNQLTYINDPLKKKSYYI